MLTQLHPLAAQAPGELQPTWAEHLDRLEELAQFLASGGSAPQALPAERAVSKAQWAEFGRLLRDKRTAAGLSRVQLARRAKLSDATVKFTETARHPPSRATLIRLVGVAELKLRWADVPGHPAPPAAETSDPPRAGGCSGCSLQLNCLLTPSYDSLRLLADLARFLNGAGGYLEQTNAYLDHQQRRRTTWRSAKIRSLSTTLRSRLPLGEVAQQIVAASGRGPLQVIALGAGDGHSETQLVAHLIEASASRVELCLLDISQPLLSCAYRHAVDRLARQPQVQVWALQGNFHHLPLYTVLHRPADPATAPALHHAGRHAGEPGPRAPVSPAKPAGLRGRRLCFCWTSLWPALPAPTAREIKRRDRLFAEGVPAPYATWLAGPLWRHCTHVERVDFHWDLETQLSGARQLCAARRGDGEVQPASRPAVLSVSRGPLRPSPARPVPERDGLGGARRRALWRRALAPSVSQAPGGSAGRLAAGPSAWDREARMNRRPESLAPAGARRGVRRAGGRSLHR